MYSNGFKVNRKENTIILTLFDMEMKTDLEEIKKTGPVEGMSTEDMLWLELITHMDNLVETLQRDIVRGGLDELKEIREKVSLQDTYIKKKVIVAAVLTDLQNTAATNV